VAHISLRSFLWVTETSANLMTDSGFVRFEYFVLMTCFRRQILVNLVLIDRAVLEFKDIVVASISCFHAGAHFEPLVLEEPNSDANF